MTKKIKDTDYLAVSARVRAMENSLLTRERMEQVLEARTDEEAVKILQECGYPELDPARPEAMDAALSQVREATLADLSDGIPDARYLDIFKLKYDYHNAKALVKGEATGADVRRLLVSGGRYSCRQLLEGFQKDALSGVSARIQQAVAAARRILADTRDPQQCDILLDKACYEEMARLAEDCASPFLKGYVRLCADTANLRTAVRVARMGKGSDFLLHVLLPGGSVAESALAAARPEDLGSLFQAGALEKAARLGARAAQPDGGPLLAFERECDNALTRYVAAAKRVPFGEEPVIAFLHAKDAELTAVRTILSGRRAGLDEAMIWERLRECYV